MVVRKAFLGISISEWVAIISIFGVCAGGYAAISSRMATTEEKVQSVEKWKEEQKTINSTVYNCISDMKGDVKEISGKLDILINRK